MDLYVGRAVSIPRPELYVVYTGERADVPDTLLLSSLYEGAGSAEIRVKVLRDSGNGDILAQYVRFCKITDSQRKLHGSTQKAIDETTEQCMNEKVLAPFLASRRKEVFEIMVMLFDQEKVWEIHDYNVAQAARQEGLRHGMERGMERGLEEGVRAMVATLRELSLGREAVAQTLASKFSLPSETAAEKVREYWEQ